MRNYLILIFLFCVLTKSNAQIPNASFEEGGGSYFNSWATYTLFQSGASNAHDGNWAIKTNMYQYPNDITHTNYSAPFKTQTAANNFYTPISSKPTRLFGWFLIPSGTGADTILVDIKFKNSGSLIGTGQFTATSFYNSYTQFSLNIGYSSALVPDSFSISIGFKSHISQYATFIVDDLSFDYTIGLPETAIEPDIIRAFPNPTHNKVHFFNEEINLKPIEKLSVFNASGQVCLSKNFSKQEITELDLTNLNTGLYFVKITLENGQVTTKKILKE